MYRLVEKKWTGRGREKLIGSEEVSFRILKREDIRDGRRLFLLLPQDIKVLPESDIQFYTKPLPLPSFPPTPNEIGINFHKHVSYLMTGPLSIITNFMVAQIIDLKDTILIIHLV